MHFVVDLSQFPVKKNMEYLKILPKKKKQQKNRKIAIENAN